jgi:hypothetical protein
MVAASVLTIISALQYFTNGVGALVRPSVARSAQGGTHVRSN